MRTEGGSEEPDHTGQRLANFLFKGPDKKYFRLSSHKVSTTQLCLCSANVAITQCANKWVWLYSNTTLFMGTEISTSYDVHVTKYQVFFF